ncbi:MAG: methionyl-tRNA formyltransferase [Rhodomicrobium sp.]
MALRVVFMGTPDFSVPTLSEIVGAGHDVAGVYTQPPRPAGRGMAERKSPVHAFAEEAAIPVFTPKSLRRPEVQEEFAALAPDIAVVVAYGLLLPRPVLEAPPLGCLNLHASLLPRWRGAAPIQRAIMEGDKETGVMVMKMDEGLDTGPVALADHLHIGPDATAGEIHDHLALMGATLMLTALDLLEKGELTFSPQPVDGVTYAPKISKEETRIDWTKPGAEVHNRIRALSPFPGAWFEALLGGKAERIKVLRSVLVPGKGDPGQLLDANLTVACGSQAVRLTQVQRSGKKPMGGADFLRGFPLGKGTQFE